MKKILYNYVLEARATAGMTQAEFAKAFKVSAPSVSAWETQQSQPRPAMAVRLANFFNTTVDKLFKLED